MACDRKCEDIELKVFLVYLFHHTTTARYLTDYDIKRSRLHYQNTFVVKSSAKLQFSIPVYFYRMDSIRILGIELEQACMPVILTGYSRRFDCGK